MDIASQEAATRMEVGSLEQESMAGGKERDEDLYIANQSEV